MRLTNHTGCAGWTRPGDQTQSGKYDVGAPDVSSGPDKNLKCRILLRGIEALVAQGTFDNSKELVLWMDWFSIEQVPITQASTIARDSDVCPPRSCTRQDDAATKLLCVRSLIFYATQSAAMLVPTREPKVSEFDYIEQLPIYGSRGWCRVEFFIFALTNEMARSERGVHLFAASTTGATRHFPKVEFAGGLRRDLPADGDLSVESDRELIHALQQTMIDAFAPAAVERACLGSPTEGELRVATLTPHLTSV